jgi:predicted type IV restriction endonuclease
MDFIDHLRVLAARISYTRALISTEEATKNAMVMPLIQILGYNVFDPLEVTPELVARSHGVTEPRGQVLHLT